ncbi:MAG: protein kinase domain-containing protein, partial [Planctomycetota bacterium]
LRFIRELGRGGLGSVWLAMQETAEFRRQVAVKLVRRGMDTDDILQRFALERQLLAALEHPNIVRLYGAGSTADGRPYFAMEYVEGMAIDRYCDDRRIGIEKRLELFVQICRAVQYAHTKLVVHRDLKPSNIIVAADGTVKLLDFGIARLVDPALSPLHRDPTAPEIRVLTPEYASPEQIRGQPVGTASDVYSLGVILFELLTGHRPYRLKTRVMREVERIVCEEEPMTPSTAVGTPSEEISVESGADGATRLVTRPVDPETLSKARGLPTETLKRRLRGDLDVIALRALAKNPDGRYPTAEALAQDVLRHLRGEPIEARPLGPLPRAWRFVRRNRAKVAVATLAVGAVVGLTASAWLAERARSAERLQAVQGELAELRLAQVKELSDTMLTRFYEKLRPMQGGAELRGILAETVARQIEALEKQDAVAGERVADERFDRLLALGYRGLGRVRGDMRGEGGGDVAAAEAAFRRSYAILDGLRKNLAPEAAAPLAREMMNTLLFWSDAVRAAGNLDEGQRLLAEADAIAVGLGAGIGRDERLLHAVVLTELGEILEKKGDLAGGAAMGARALDIRRALVALEPDNLDLARALGKGLSAAQFRAEQAGRADDAVRIAEELVALRTRLAAVRPEDARIARELMLAKLALGRSNLRAGRAAGAVDGIVAASAVATERVERTPDSHEALSDRAQAYEAAAQVFGELGRHDDALERWRLARADLARASTLAPAQKSYPQRAAYLGASEAKTLATLGRNAEAATVSAGAARSFEAMLPGLRGNAEAEMQAAITMAVASSSAAKAGDAAAAKAFADAARATLGAIAGDMRERARPFVEAELGGS